MQPLRARSICRSHNHFRLSIALWQNFVQPARTLFIQQPLTSSASQATGHHGSEPSGGALALLEPSSVSGDNATGVNPTTNSSNTDNLIKYKSCRGPSQKHRLKQGTLRTTKQRFNAGLDYDAQNIIPQVPRTIADRSLPFYVAPDDKMESMTRLSLEIRKFYEYVSPSRTEALARRHVIEQVRGHVREVLPNYLLEVFGSERTGLALAISDIDLRLYDASLPTETLESQLPPDVAQRRALLIVLHDLRKALVRRPEYSRCEITYSRIPLIDLVDKETEVRVQIVLSNDTSLARENMAKYMRDYPCLRKVFMLIKSMFEIRCLTDVFYGGFGTYSLFYMIVASILQAQKENPKLYKNPDAATVFLKFLGFWGSHRTDLTGISIEPFHMFPKDKEVVMNDRTKSRMTEDKTKPLPNYMLCLRDPVDPTNDLGRKGFCIKHFQRVCSMEYKALYRDLKTNRHAPFLKRSVGVVYGTYLKRREKLDLRGRAVLSELRDSVTDAVGAHAKLIREGKGDQIGRDLKEPASESEAGKAKPIAPLPASADSSEDQGSFAAMGASTLEELATAERREAEEQQARDTDKALEQWITEGEGAEAPVLGASATTTNGAHSTPLNQPADSSESQAKVAVDASGPPRPDEQEAESQPQLPGEAINTAPLSDAIESQAQAAEEESEENKLLAPDLNTALSDLLDKHEHRKDGQP